LSLIQRFSSSILAKKHTIILIVSVFAVSGTILELSGGIWDAVSHIMREPEFFWTIQHISVYAGVGMIAISGIIGSVLLLNGLVIGSVKRIIQIIIIGSILQITSGYADSLSHDLFGIDGLISLSHQALEVGLVLCALGGFLMISKMTYKKTRKFLPFSIITLIFSISWLGFNLSLLVGSTVLCLPIYKIFNSGCAIF